MFSVLIVVLMVLLIDTMIDKAPVIFLKVAEVNTGELDGIIYSNKYTFFDSDNFLNFT